MTPAQFANFKAEQPECSFALWNPSDYYDVSVIERAGQAGLLRADAVLVGLNPSREISGELQNFHGGGNARKLAEAIEGTCLEGCAMIDALDIVEPDSAKIASHTFQRPTFIRKLPARPVALYAFGWAVFKMLKSGLIEGIDYHRLVRLPHYSARSYNRRGTYRSALHAVLGAEGLLSPDES